MKAWRLALLGLGLCTLGVTADAADVTTLLYASPYSPNHPFSRADITWIHWVEQQSGGSLHILPIWSGALLSSDQSLTELRHGVSDIGLITPIYVKGGEHLLRIQTGFYDGARSFEQQVAMYRCLAAASPEFNRELAGLKILAVQGGTLPGILTRNRELTSLNDLAGLRIRVPTELLGVLRDLGADPVNMPMGEVYSALAKGVIDGVIAPADTFKSLHFSEVAKYFYQLQVPRGAYPARAIGERRWLSLSARARAILEASTPIWEAALAQETKAAVAAGVAQGQHDGVHFLVASTADQQRFDELYERDAERNARSLSRYDIDGIDVFHYARQIADGISASGRVNCSAMQISP